MAGNTLSTSEIADMVRHWLATPVNAYLGSGYGNDLKALLQQPMNSGLADGFLQKLVADVPVLAALPAGALNLYMEPVGKDQQRLIIDIAGTVVSVDSLGAIA